VTQQQQQQAGATQQCQPASEQPTHGASGRYQCWTLSVQSHTHTHTHLTSPHRGPAFRAAQYHASLQWLHQYAA